MTPNTEPGKKMVRSACRLISERAWTRGKNVRWIDIYNTQYQMIEGFLRNELKAGTRRIHAPGKVASFYAELFYLPRSGA